jgi:lipopolysaccharide transport system permease protein
LPSWKILLLPICTALIMLFTISIGILLSALNVLYRDVKHALPFLLQLMMFITPVFYSVNFLPEKWRILWYLNPLTGSFEAMRSSLFDLEINFIALIFSIILTIITFITSLYVFSKLEDSFADII